MRLRDDAGQAGTLNQLGVLHKRILNRPEEAASFFRRAAEKSTDPAREGMIRNNFADTLRRLNRFDEARQEILRAIECKAQFGHASEP
jgi:Flp pilus assembly protein TadD